MKFKNYVNSLTGDNRIYSLNDITQMALGDVLKNKEELLSQYRVLGVPTESELQNSDNVVYVKAYTRDDGMEVKAHYRSKPDGIQSNNLSAQKNSSDTSSGALTGGASGVNMSSEFDPDEEDMYEYELDEPVVDVSTPEKVEKLMYPDEIAGVKRGEPKSFIEMMQQGVNPKYCSEEDTEGEYSNNCACCTVAGELIQRGYNVEAGPADNQITKKNFKSL